MRSLNTAFYVRLYILQYSLILKTQVSFSKTYVYNFTPLKPHFYIVKLGFTGYALFFLL